MPGLDKGNVKVSVKQNTLVTKGEGPKEFDDGDSSWRRSTALVRSRLR
uniref:Uncharacterized protein n=1 Tax=Rhizophora mucronata TaxID=61149 RepID=A0A2P2Q5E2_RHIMU